MLARKNRLSRTDFDVLLKTGRAFHCPALSLRVAKTPGASRFSVVVSKKTAKTAVLRNRIRRRLYSLLRAEREKLLSGFSAAFFVKEKNLPYDVLRTEAATLLQKAGLLR